MMQWDGLRYTENTLADIMKKKEMMHSMEQQEKRFFAQKLEPRNPYTSPEYGLLEQTVNVGDKTRRFFVYIPKDVRPSTSGVFVFGGNGTTAEQLMESSGWKEMAFRSQNRLYHWEKWLKNNDAMGWLAIYRKHAGRYNEEKGDDAQHGATGKEIFCAEA